MSRRLDNFWHRPLARNFILWSALLWLARWSAFADQSVTLTWNPSSDTNVAGYKIYFGGASRVYTNAMTLGNVTNVTISGLSAGATYFFGATTMNATGIESDFSNEATYAIPLAVSNLPPAVVVSPPVVKPPPTLGVLTNLTIYKNAGPQTVALSGITAGANNASQTLKVSASSSNAAIITVPQVNYTSPNSSGTLIFAPVTNALGTATVTVTVNNGGVSNNLITRTFTVTVVTAPVVNQPPTLNVITNVIINQSAAAQTLTLTGITSGSPTEKQTLTVTASSSNPALVPAPTVRYTSPASTGQLLFKPTMNVSGVAVITVTVNDGGSSNNLIRQNFTITVLPNLAPTLNPIANVTVSKNAAAQTVVLTGITSGSPAEKQTLAVTASSSNPALVPAPTIRYTSPATTALLLFKPAANASGAAVITVTVNDGGNSNNIIRQNFTVTVLAPANRKAISAASSAASAATMQTKLVVSSSPAATLTTVANAKGQFGFQVTGVAGGQYVVQATSDLVHWTSVETNTAPFTFQDSNTSGFSRRFYRAYFVQ
jgi:hypothetical protein